MTRDDPARTDSQGAPTFGLYGEAETRTSAEFLHIEDIRSRSALHGWEIRPHRHRGLMQLLVATRGRVEVDVDLDHLVMGSPVAVLVNEGVVHAFRFEPGTEGFVLTVARDLLGRVGDPRIGALTGALGDGAHVLGLDELDGDGGEITTLLEIIHREPARGDLASASIREWLAVSLLAILGRWIAARPAAEGTQGEARRQLGLFRALVEQRFREHWSIGNYAAALGLTDSRLNRLCKRLAGRRAFEIVQDRLMLEARRQLVYGAGSVSDIAYDLGFDDAAYFWRRFRKLEGVTPAGFRRAHGRGG